MTLQSSGAISLANVQTEFGGFNPIGINEYYAAAAGVPVSGTISLYNFYGKSAAPPSSVFTTYGMGIQNSSGLISSSYSGTIITPGAAASPTTFIINCRMSPAAAIITSAQFRAYLNGGISNTFDGYQADTVFLWAYSGGSIQFRSFVLNEGNAGSVGYAHVNVGQTRVYEHSMTSDGGYSGDD